MVCENALSIKDLIIAIWESWNHFDKAYFALNYWNSCMTIQTVLRSLKGITKDSFFSWWIPKCVPLHDLEKAMPSN